MASCFFCGASFTPQVPGWSDVACGDCIATQIELALTGGLAMSDRKPLRRASGSTAAADESLTASGAEMQESRAA